MAAPGGQVHPFELVLGAGCRIYSVRLTPILAAAVNFQPEFEDPGSLEEAQEVGFAGFRVEVAGENRGDFTLKFIVADLDAYVG